MSQLIRSKNKAHLGVDRRSFAVGRPFVMSLYISQKYALIGLGQDTRFKVGPDYI